MSGPYRTGGPVSGDSDPQGIMTPMLQAYQVGRRDERAAIVRWIHDGAEFHPEVEAGREAREIADAIEEGAHAKRPAANGALPTIRELSAMLEGRRMERRAFAAYLRRLRATARPGGELETIASLIARLEDESGADEDHHP